MRNLIFVLSLGGVFLACTHDPIERTKPNSQLMLKWNRGYEEELRSDIDTGILWTLSFLGANLPEGSYRDGAQWNGDTLRLDLSILGFNEKSYEAIFDLTQVIKASEEYKTLGSMDVGRFVSLLLLSSPHYYAITDVPKSLEAFMAGRRFDQEVAIMKSTISKNARLISYASPDVNVLHQAFIAKEGFFDSASASMTVKEFEIMDIMPNGQLRFAIYDQQGELLDYADTTYSSGGKPAKCLWCHETNINKNFALSGSHPEFLSVTDFNTQVEILQEKLKSVRQTINSDLDYTSAQAHTKAELLYISFMEPSAARLALEWNMSESEVEVLLSSLPTHDHEEFSFLKNRYHRKDVEAFAPYQSVLVSDDAREGGGHEPNLIP